MSMREREKIQEVLRGIDKGENPSDPPRIVHIAGIQFSAKDDRDYNLKRAETFAKVALDKGANILCFSALFSLPWYIKNTSNYSEYSESIPGPTTEPFIHLAKEYKAVILCPVYERSAEKRFNSVAVVDCNGILGVYRKNQIPDIPFWEEKKLFMPGDIGYPVFKTPFATIGIQICWDNFFPEGSRILAMKGAEIIFSPTAAAFDSHFRWEAVIKANAITNNLYVFRINRVGKECDLTFYGKSFCVNPFGEFSASPAFHRDAVIMAEIDISAVSLARREFPFLIERRTDLYSDLIDGGSE
ncbi:acyltransferase [bacterium]|nr:acyltransferase [candidate division CSSED10-310 bacterium]